MLRKLLQDEDAVSIVLGKLLNLVVLMAITGSIVGVFYLYTDSSSQKSMRAGFADLGSQIARDITNIYLISENSKNISLTVRREIPLTYGGKGYSIELKSLDNGYGYAVEIIDQSFLGYRIRTTISSIDASVNTSMTRPVYSGSGEIEIGMIKNDTVAWAWIQ